MKGTKVCDGTRKRKESEISGQLYIEIQISLQIEIQIQIQRELKEQKMKQERGKSQENLASCL